MKAELKTAIDHAARSSDQAYTHLRNALGKADPVEALIIYDLITAQAQIDIKIRGLQEALRARGSTQEQQP